MKCECGRGIPKKSFKSHLAGIHHNILRNGGSTDDYKRMMVIRNIINQKYIALRACGTTQPNLNILQNEINSQIKALLDLIDIYLIEYRKVDELKRTYQSLLK